MPFSHSRAHISSVPWFPPLPPPPMPGLNSELFLRKKRHCGPLAILAHCAAFGQRGSSSASQHLLSSHSQLSPSPPPALQVPISVLTSLTSPGSGTLLRKSPNVIRSPHTDVMRIYVALVRVLSWPSVGLGAAGVSLRLSPILQCLTPCRAQSGTSKRGNE